MPRQCLGWGHEKKQGGTHSTGRVMMHDEKRHRREIMCGFFFCFVAVFLSSHFFVCVGYQVPFSEPNFLP